MVPGAGLEWVQGRSTQLAPRQPAIPPRRCGGQGWCAGGGKRENCPNRKDLRILQSIEDSAYVSRNDM